MHSTLASIFAIETTMISIISDSVMITVLGENV